MAFEIVNETYYTDENQDPKRFGYIEGYMATKTKIKVDATGYCAECKREYPIDRFYTSNASFLGNGHLN